MTELERKIRSKIPGEDTGIAIRPTMCDICSPGMHCGINAYVKDGTVIKIEGMDGHPVNDGRLCPKGLSNRQYIYRWLRRYDGSIASLRDRSRRPHHHPNQHTPEEIKLILDMRRRNPEAGLVVSWVKLRQRG